LAFCLTSRSRSERRPTPHGEDNPDHEHFQHFCEGAEGEFWGDLQGEAQRAAKKVLRVIERAATRPVYGGSALWPIVGPQDHRNGYYLRILSPASDAALAHCAQPQRGFLPRSSGSFSGGPTRSACSSGKRFLRGISTRQVGRVVGLLTGEVVSAQTVSQLTRDLDEAVRQFHQAPLADEWAYLFLDAREFAGASAERPAAGADAGAYGVRRDGTRHCWPFCAYGRKPKRVGGVARDLYRRGLGGRELAAHRHRRLCPDWRRRFRRLPAGAASALLGHKMRTFWSTCANATMTRLKRMPSDLGADQPTPGGSGLSRLPSSLATRLTAHGAATGARSCRSCFSFFSFPRPSVEEAAHHQHHRALLVEVRRRTRPWCAL